MVSVALGSTAGIFCRLPGVRDRLLSSVKMGRGEDSAVPVGV